jgi:hypothetical protein
LELQARAGDRVGGCWNVQEGRETDGLPRLVDALCGVRDGLCRDILCLVRWVGRQAHGRSVRCERLSGNGKEGRSSMHHGRELDVSYPSSDERNPCGMGRLPFTGGAYAESHLVGRRREPDLGVRVVSV